MLRFVLPLLVLLSACGRTESDGSVPSVSSVSAGAGGTGSSGAAGAPSVAGAGGAPANCLFPVQGLVVPPSADKPPTRYRLSSPYSIEQAYGSPELAAAYDVNGDAVSDLLVLDLSQMSRRFRLLLSGPPPGVFDMVESDCAALRQLPEGRLLLRDLDGDGVPDFIVGTNAGVDAYLNHEDGLVQVLSYALPAPTVRASLLNVGVADLDGNGQLDLVVSFDRVLNEQVLQFELLDQAFFQRGGAFEEGAWVATTFADGEVSSGPQLSGYLTAGRFRPSEGGRALLVGRNASSSSTRFVMETTFDGMPPTPLLGALDQDVSQVFALPRGDQHAQLLAVGQNAFYRLDLHNPDADGASTLVPTLVAKGALVHEGGESHELGGGAEMPRHFVYDIDRDGDLDFLERDAYGPRLTLHLSLGEKDWQLTQFFDIRMSGSAETPFIQVGPGGGIVGQPRPGGALAVYTLVAESE